MKLGFILLHEQYITVDKGVDKSFYYDLVCDIIYL